MPSLRPVMIVPILAVLIVVVLVASSYTLAILAQQNKFMTYTQHQMPVPNLWVQFNATETTALTALGLVDLLPYFLAIATIVAGVFLILKMAR